MPSSNRSVSPSARERKDHGLRDVYSGSPDSDSVKRKRDGSVERRTPLTPHPHLGGPLLPLGGAGEAEPAAAREDVRGADAREDAHSGDGTDSYDGSDDGQESRPDSEYEDLLGMEAATNVLRGLRESNAELGELTLPDQRRGGNDGGHPHDEGAPGGLAPADGQARWDQPSFDGMREGTHAPATHVAEGGPAPATRTIEGGKSQFNTAQSLSEYEVVSDKQPSGLQEEAHGSHNSSGAPRMAAGIGWRPSAPIVSHQNGYGHLS